MFKHILICTDGSPLSNKAAKAGIAPASVLRAKVTAHYAIEPMKPVYVEGSAFNQKMSEGIEDSALKAGQKREKSGRAMPSSWPCTAGAAFPG